MPPRQRVAIGEEAEAFRKQVLQEHANAGYGLMTRRTHLISKTGNAYRMLLLCDRFGEYKGNPTGRRTSTRKCGCTYRVDCRLDRDLGRWFTVVPPEFSTHNHDPSFEMASPAIRRSSRMGREDQILRAIRRGDRLGKRSAAMARELTESMGVLITQEDIRNIKSKWKQAVAAGTATEEEVAANDDQDGEGALGNVLDGDGDDCNDAVGLQPSLSVPIEPGLHIVPLTQVQPQPQSQSSDIQQQEIQIQQQQQQGAQQMALLQSVQSDLVQQLQQQIQQLKDFIESQRQHIAMQQQQIQGQQQQIQGLLQQHQLQQHLHGPVQL